jgi:dTDP-4-amino-4,6-dideoxygalactose transaminase
MAMRLSKSVLGPDEQEAVRRILANEFLGTGPETQAFEQELAEYIGNTHVVCVNTGTAALQLALQACGITVGDEVLAPSLTFLSTFQAISATGARPVACEVKASTGLLDLDDAARRLTPRTRAIMPVHYASAVGDLDAIYDFARASGLRVLEDAAHAFGCTYEGKRIGSFGDVACFSFDGIKNITSGEGGAVSTRDPLVLQKIQDARLLGVERDSEKRYQRERSWEFEVHEQGWRCHMSDIMAAIGRVQLRRFETEFRPKRVALASLYREKLAGHDKVRLFEADLGPVVPHIMPVRIPAELRDRARKILLDKGIQTGIHYKPNHLLARYGGGSVSLPVTERIYPELLTLPLHADLSPADVETVVSTLVGAL